MWNLTPPDQPPAGPVFPLNPPASQLQLGVCLPVFAQRLSQFVHTRRRLGVTGTVGGDGGGGRALECLRARGAEDAG